MALSLNISSTDYSVLYLPQSLTDAEKAQVRENIGVAEEKDPTVPSWAKQQNKPTYTAAEVGALPDTTVIPTVPTNISDFVNDAGYAKTVDVVTNVNGQTGDVQTHLTVTIAANEDGTYTSSHTPQEIYAATQAGVVVEASDANGKRYSLYTCNEKGAQFLTMGVRGSSGKRILYTESFVISSNKVGKGTTETPIPVASVPMVGATGTAAGTAGLVPAPAKGDNGKFLRGDGTWREIGADESGAASDAVSSHNVNTSAHTDIREQISQLNSDKADKTGLTLGVHTDGLVYLFVNGSPQGNGLDIKAEVVEGDVFGYVDENNNIVLNGNLVEGTYTIKYEMEDGSLIDIGNLELDNSVYYTITNNLTNCTNGNVGITSVSAGDDYIAVINPVGNTEITSITVTMGGKDITASAVIFNPACLVEIRGVTGDVVITAVAEEKAIEAEPTNFCVVDTSVTSAPNPSSPNIGYANTNSSSPSYGWISGGRCSSTGENRMDSTPTCVTNYISVQNGDIVYVKNLDISTSVYSGIYKSDYSPIAGFMINASATHVKDVNLSGEWEQFTINNANAGFIRICGTPSIYKNVNGANFFDKYDVNNLNIVINIKRNGEWLVDGESTYTNFIEYNATNTTDWSIYCTNARIGSDGAYRSSTTQDVTNYIAVQNGDEVHWHNMAINRQNVCLYKTDKVAIMTSNVDSLQSSGYIADATTLDAQTYDGQFTITNASAAYIRFTINRGEYSNLPPSGYTVNIKRNGEWLVDSEPTYTNLATPDATATGQAAWESGGWCNNSYMAGTSYAYREATDGRLTTNTFAVEKGDIIYVKGIKYATDSTLQIAAFDSNKTLLKHAAAATMGGGQGYINSLTGTAGEDSWSFKNSGRGGSDTGIRFIRIAGYPSGSINDIIITRNQPIS